MPSAKLIEGLNGVSIGTSGGAELCNFCSCPYCACNVSYVVTFADVELPTGCTDRGGDSFNTSTAVLAGAFTLTLQPRSFLNQPCIWLYTEAPSTSVVGTHYADPGCSGVSSAYPYFEVRLFRDGVGNSNLTSGVTYGGTAGGETLFRHNRTGATADPCNPLTGWVNSLAAGTATLAEDVEEDI